ncbi:MAG: RnfABCDGE type electron transport complex subunit D [Candidatus Omnitrophica bacterium]|nr:RnfABCDGE type electron transport complex subunit D [Candidatus Omnitrophota bacterium]
MALIVSNSPHLRSKVNTPFLMKQVIIALIPAGAASIYLFGPQAIWLISNCIISALLTEAVILKIRKKPLCINDFSAILTGLLLALTLPPSTKWYGASLGSIVAVSVGKHIFGGLGSNIFNPALVGRAFLMAAYPKMLTTFSSPRIVDAVTTAPPDALSGATPLVLLKFNQIAVDIGDLFIGRVSGSLGETSAICLIIGAIYLLLRKVISWRIPLSLLLTTTILSAIFFLLNPSWGSVWFHLFGGGLLLGAFFMATDPVTTPTTKRGRYIFGIGCGVLIMIIRYFSGLPEGVMYSILFMNALTPLINRYTKPRRFGT